MSQRAGRVGKRRPARTATVSALLLVAAAVTPTAAQAATATTLYVSPTGSGTACSAAAPCSLAQAKTSVEAIDGSMSGDIVVQLAGGTYRLTSPLSLGSADSGSNGYTVRWQAAAGQTPVISGGQQVTGWTLHDATNNIYAAAVPVGGDSRQLYIDGAPAPRAAVSIARTDVAFTSTGMTIQNANLDYLASLPEQNRIELEAQNSFTDRYAPVQSISGTTITMQQPAWNNNSWGYDTLESPFAGGALQLENSYSFLNTAGQWYLDPQAGELYYKAPSGWNPASHDVELPQATSILSVSGSYSSPVHNIAFQGISFEDATWLAPSTSIGYADQQNGGFLPQAYSTEPSNFLTSCQVGCQGFEATRNSWDQVPAAVQVTAASAITFSGNTFSDLGEVGLGIGQDADAVVSGVGLGASGVTVDHNTFNNDSGAGIVVGGIQPDAHHPSNVAMTNQNITISNNLVTNAAEDYKDMSGILSTYVTHAVITHNEVSNLAYDGIDIGWGWGINDPGGSQDYANRGTYNYQPIYSTPTTLKNTIVTYNLVHDIKKVFHDGGSIYTLSANPGGVIDDNYVYNNNHSIGLYLDEGSRYLTLSYNVLQDNRAWANLNANSTNNTDDNTFSYNWYNSGGANVPTGAPHNNVVTGNVQVTGTNWPAGALEVISQAGISNNGGIGTAPVHAVGSGKCMDVTGGSTTPGVQMEIWDCSGSTNQTFTHTSTGQITVYSGGSQLCLDASGGKTSPGTSVITWTCNGAANQQWTLNDDGTITGVQSGLCLDVTGGSTGDGAKLEIWTCDGGANQQWNLG